MIPFRSLLMIASSDDAMIAARKFFAVSVNTVGLPKTLAVSGFFKLGRLRTDGMLREFRREERTLLLQDMDAAFHAIGFALPVRKRARPMQRQRRASLPVEYQNVRLAPPRTVHRHRQHLSILGNTDLLRTHEILADLVG